MPTSSGAGRRRPHARKRLAALGSQAGVLIIATGRGTEPPLDTRHAPPLGAVQLEDEGSHPPSLASACNSATGTIGCGSALVLERLVVYGGEAGDQASRFSMVRKFRAPAQRHDDNTGSRRGRASTPCSLTRSSFHFRRAPQVHCRPRHPTRAPGSEAWHEHKADCRILRGARAAHVRTATAPFDAGSSRVPPRAPCNRARTSRPRSARSSDWRAARDPARTSCKRSARPGAGRVSWEPINLRHVPDEPPTHYLGLVHPAADTGSPDRPRASRPSSRTSSCSPPSASASASR